MSRITNVEAFLLVTAFGSFVCEKTIEMWQVYRRRTKSDDIT